MPKKKKRYKVAPGDNYMTIAANTGSSPDALASANPAISSPSAGFYINLPPPPPFGSSPTIPSPGYQQTYQSSATTTPTPGFTSTGYYSSPLSPPVDQVYGQPVYDANGNVLTATGGVITPQPIGGTEGSGVGVSTAPNDLYGVDAYGNTAVNLVTDEQRYADGVTVTQMQDAGYTFDINTRTWTLATPTATPVEQRNAGGWYTSSDGSTRLNRNQSQIDRRKERRNKNNSNSSQSAVINWSL